VTTSDKKKYRPSRILLRLQLSSGSINYYINVITISIIRIFFIIAIWSFLLTRHSQTPELIAIIILITYALLEIYSTIVKIRTSQWAIKHLNGWHNDF